MRLKKTTTAISKLALFFIFLTIPGTVLAAAYDWWGDPSTTLGLANKDLELVIIEIIKWVLGLTGLISVIMVLYGGYTWLTSAGNEEKIKKAKKVLSAAVIGLVVIFLSWAILYYVAWTISLAETT